MAPDAVGRLQRRTADGKKSGAMVSSAHQPTSAQGRKAARHAPRGSLTTTTTTTSKAQCGIIIDTSSLCSLQQFRHQQGEQVVIQGLRFTGSLHYVHWRQKRHLGVCRRHSRNSRTTWIFRDEDPSRRSFYSLPSCLRHCNVTRLFL